MELKVNNIHFGSREIYNSKVTKKVTNTIPKETIKTTSKSARKILYGMTTLFAMAGSFVAGLFTNKPQKDVPSATIEQVVQPKTIVDSLKKDTFIPPEFVVVKDGDCIWNITKDIISENGKKQVTDPEIHKKHLEILKANGLKYPSDTTDVILIHKGDTLFTSVKARKKDIAKKITKLIKESGKI